MPSDVQRLPAGRASRSAASIMWSCRTLTAWAASPASMASTIGAWWLPDIMFVWCSLPSLKIVRRTRPSKCRQASTNTEFSVPDRQQESVPALPVWVIGAVPQLVHVRHSEYVGDAERLADVSLALYLAHVQGVAPDPVRRVPQCGESLSLLVGGRRHPIAFLTGRS